MDICSAPVIDPTILHKNKKQKKYQAPPTRSTEYGVYDERKYPLPSGNVRVNAGYGNNRNINYYYCEGKGTERQAIEQIGNKPIIMYEGYSNMPRKQKSPYRQHLQNQNHQHKNRNRQDRSMKQGNQNHLTRVKSEDYIKNAYYTGSPGSNIGNTKSKLVGNCTIVQLPELEATSSKAYRNVKPKPNHNQNHNQSRNNQSPNLNHSPNTRSQKSASLLALHPPSPSNIQYTTNHYNHTNQVSNIRNKSNTKYQPAQRQRQKEKEVHADIRKYSELANSMVAVSEVQNQIQLMKENTIYKSKNVDGNQPTTYTKQQEYFGLFAAKSRCRQLRQSQIQQAMNQQSNNTYTNTNTNTNINLNTNTNTNNNNSKGYQSKQKQKSKQKQDIWRQYNRLKQHMEFLQQENSRIKEQNYILNKNYNKVKQQLSYTHHNRSENKSPKYSPLPLSSIDKGSQIRKDDNDMSLDQIINNFSATAQFYKNSSTNSPENNNPHIRIQLPTSHTNYKLDRHIDMDIVRSLTELSDNFHQMEGQRQKQKFVSLHTHHVNNISNNDIVSQNNIHNHSNNNSVDFVDLLKRARQEILMRDSVISQLEGKLVYISNLVVKNNAQTFINNTNTLYNQETITNLHNIKSPTQLNQSTTQMHVPPPNPNNNQDAKLLIYELQKRLQLSQSESNLINTKIQFLENRFKMAMRDMENLAARCQQQEKVILEKEVEIQMEMRHTRDMLAAYIRDRKYNDNTHDPNMLSLNYQPIKKIQSKSISADSQNQDWYPVKKIHPQQVQQQLQRKYETYSQTYPHNESIGSGNGNWVKKFQSKQINHIHRYAELSLSEYERQKRKVWYSREEEELRVQAGQLNFVAIPGHLRTIRQYSNKNTIQCSATQHYSLPNSNVLSNEKYLNLGENITQSTSSPKTSNAVTVAYSQAQTRAFSQVDKDSNSNNNSNSNNLQLTFRKKKPENLEKP